MEEPKTLVQQLKEHYNKQKKTHGKMISVSAIINKIKPHVDWNEVAYKCSINESHEHFGKEPAEILKIWRSKANRGAGRGVSLDNYIQYYIEHGKVMELGSDTDEKTRGKCEAWLKFYQERIEPKIECVGTELWMASELGYHGRLDYLGKMKDRDVYIIIDWKNTEKYRLENSFQKLRGCMSAFDECEKNNYTLQTHLYKKVLREIGIESVSTCVVQVLADEVVLHKDGFGYSDERVKDIVSFVK